MANYIFTIVELNLNLRV